MDPSSVTLDSVASIAGVSRQTVSNVLHHPARVTERTRVRVENALRKSGYRASLPARQLATRRAHAIAVRAERQQDGISGLVLDAFYHGLAEAGYDSGLRVLLYPQQPDEAAELALIEELLHSHAADAVVLTATSATDGRPQQLRASALPFCAFGRPWGHEDVPHDWVDVDGAAGTSLAVEHLIERGRRHIAWLGWPEEPGLPSTGTDRRRGWDLALTRGRGGDRRIEAACENDSAAAEAVVRGLLEGGDAPDAIVCASDTLALGAYRAGLAAGTSSDGVPFEIVGFDATPVAAALGFASVEQPIDQVAHRCIDLLLARQADPQAPAQSALLAPRLRIPS